jgi:hypothetical protein
LNLIQKEIHLLQPVWLLTLLWIALTVCIGLLRFLQIKESILGQLAVASDVIYVLLLGTLAGVVSMGEERQSGTHSWHLTLPVSLLRQWSIKLAVILAASFMCGVAVFGTASLSVGLAFQDALGNLVHGNVFALLFGALLLLPIPAFWCACGVKGTVRAAALIIPVWLVLGFTIGATVFFLESRSASSVMEDLVRSVHAFPPSHGLTAILNQQGRLRGFSEMLVLLLALFQSYRLFRLERSEDIASIGRPLMHLCVVVFLCVFCTGALDMFVRQIYRQEFRVTRELAEAVDKLDLDPAAFDAAHPLLITAEDLNKVYPLSEMSRAWLANSQITVLPKPVKPPLGMKNGKLRELNAKYAAHLYFRNGSECKVYDVRTICRAPGDVPGRLWTSVY